MAQVRCCASLDFAPCRAQLLIGLFTLGAAQAQDSKLQHTGSVMGLKAVVCFRRASETAGIPAAGAIRPRRIPAIDSPAGAQRLSCKLCVCVCSRARQGHLPGPPHCSHLLASGCRHQTQTVTEWVARCHIESQERSNVKHKDSLSEDLRQACAVTDVACRDFWSG